jgi:uncharacterized membrane protein
MLTRLRDNFIAGIAVILPVAITWWLLIALYNAVNDGILNPLLKTLRPYLTNIYLEYGARTLIFLILLAIVSLIGLATRILFIRKVFSKGERIFFKIPMVGKVYVTIKQMSRAFLGDRKGIFKAPVLVEYPRKGIYSIGFLTSDSKGEIQNKTEKKLINIFIPTTPNPTSGILLMVPQDEVIALNMNVEEAMKLVISGGIVAPGELQQD